MDTRSSSKHPPTHIAAYLPFSHYFLRNLVAYFPKRTTIFLADNLGRIYPAASRFLNPSVEPRSPPTPSSVDPVKPTTNFVSSTVAQPIPIPVSSHTVTQTTEGHRAQHHYTKDEMNSTPPNSPPLPPRSPQSRAWKRVNSKSPDRQAESLRNALFISSPPKPQMDHSPPKSPTLIPFGIGAGHVDTVHPMVLFNFHESPAASYGASVNCVNSGNDDHAREDVKPTEATSTTLSPSRSQRAAQNNSEKDSGETAEDFSLMSTVPFAYESDASRALKNLVSNEEPVLAPGAHSEVDFTRANNNGDENVTFLAGAYLSQSPPSQPPSSPLLALTATLSLAGLISQSQQIEDREMPEKIPASENGRREKMAVPKFFFPLGKAFSSTEYDKKREDILCAVLSIYDNRPYLHEAHFVAVTKACGLPRYMNLALFRRMNEMGLQDDKVTFEQFASAWAILTKDNHDECSLIFALLKRRNMNTLTTGDFFYILDDVVCNHPGLEFLASNTLFQERYVETVISRFFYDNRCMSGRMTMSQLKRSGLPNMLRRLEQGIDLNLTHDCFSYKHFYVIYCKFWELDQDHDLVISDDDLAKYGGYALTPRTIKRVFHFAKINDPTRRGLITPGEENKMSYPDFIWFLLSEVDKHTPTSIEYWFHCLDIDDDGIISSYELAYFYEEQMQRQIIFGIPEQDRLQFEDAMCQANDLVQPAVADQFTLQDLKRCKVAERFFDMFINLSKLQMHESSHNSIRLKRQYILAQRTETFEMEEEPVLGSDGDSTSEWCTYAEFEYQLLVLTERNQGSSEELEDGDLEEMYDFGDSDPHEITMDPIESAGVGQFTGLTRVMELERVPGEGGAGESDEYTMAERCGSGCAGVKTSEMFMDVDRSGKEGLMSGDTGTGMGRMQRRSLRVEQQVV